KITLTACLFGLTIFTFAQNDQKEHQLEKFIEIEKTEDGQQKMTITTNDNGQIQTETFRGNQVDEQLEMLNHNSNTEEKIKYKRIVLEDGADGSAINVDIEKILNHMTVITEQIEGENQIVYKVCANSTNGENYTQEWITTDEVRKEDAPIEIIQLEEVFEDVEDLTALLNSLDVRYEGDAEASKRVVVRKTISIEEKEQEGVSVSENNDEMHFYPNPNTGIFTLDFSTNTKRKAEITITDIAGKHVYNGTVKGKTNYQLAIDISNESKGIYVVKVQQGDEVKAQKVLVE
ncbi:T9SS type A sorting domain-containing protein, partial [Flavobacteriales bacterium]|nr:T9SS type A sorting domain-containing protein [Flavobacteriales bacterium]